MRCEFCKLNSIKDQIIKEFERLYIILPRKPINDYHFIVLTKDHYETFDKVDDHSAIEIKEVFKKIDLILSTNTNYVGYNFFSNNGSQSIGQTVPHFHLHIFVRFKDENLSPYEILNGIERRKEYNCMEYNQLLENHRLLLK